MEARSLRFAATARALGEAARRDGLCAPAFRSPPRVKGRMRTLRRHANGSATVSVVVRERPWHAVVADMIEGFVAVNAADRAEEVRDLLWGTIEHIELPEPSKDPSPSTPLQVVDEAA